MSWKDIAREGLNTLNPVKKLGTVVRAAGNTSAIARDLTGAALAAGAAGVETTGFLAQEAARLQVDRALKAVQFLVDGGITTFAPNNEMLNSVNDYMQESVGTPDWKVFHAEQVDMLVDESRGQLADVIGETIALSTAIMLFNNVPWIDPRDGKQYYAYTPGREEAMLSYADEQSDPNVGTSTTTLVNVASTLLPASKVGGVVASTVPGKFVGGTAIKGAVEALAPDGVISGPDLGFGIPGYQPGQTPSEAYPGMFPPEEVDDSTGSGWQMLLLNEIAQPEPVVTETYVPVSAPTTEEWRERTYDAIQRLMKIARDPQFGTISQEADAHLRRINQDQSKPQSEDWYTFVDMLEASAIQAVS